MFDYSAIALLLVLGEGVMDVAVSGCYRLKTSWPPSRRLCR
jgi:hypothetical protein